MAFLVNGGPGSAMAERAAAFASRLAQHFEICQIYREGGTANAAARMLRRLKSFQPDCCLVFDLAAAGVLAAGLYKLASRTPFVLDTGDDIVALGRALGRGPVKMLATRLLETYALGSADQVVVRGSFHTEVLKKRGIESTFIPDGVDPGQVTFDQAPAVDPGGKQTLTVGLIGSSIWIPARQSCYGWELVELVHILKSRLPGHQVRGILIGDGSGIPVLQERCRKYAIEDRIEFAGRIPFHELPAWLQRFDICLSTQTDDAIGWVRTTGKLPLYLAAGRFVLASNVGEASRVLPRQMLVEFRGSVDPEYPLRLAARIEQLVAEKTSFGHRPDCVAIAREHFDYDRLAQRLAEVLQTALEPGP